MPLLKKCLALILLGSLFMYGTAYAKSTHTVELLSKNTSEQALVKQAFRRLIKQLTKKSPPPIRARELMSLVAQYQFKEHQGEQVFSVDFDKELVRAWMMKKKLVLELKPELVVWTALLTDDKQSLLGVANSNQVLRAFIDASKKLKIAFMVPEMDLEDMQRLDFDTVWNDESGAMTKATKRYQLENYLILKIAQLDNDKWQARWHLNHARVDNAFNLEGSSVEEIMLDGVSQVKALLNQATSKEAEQTFYIQVESVSQAGSLSKLSTFLRGLSGVRRVALDGVTPEQVLYKLETSLTKGHLEALLGEHHHLEKTGPDNNNRLYYRLTS